MPVCKNHQKWPCVDCMINEYQRCIKDNEIRKAANKPLDQNGKLLLHDTEGLKQKIEQLGGKIC